MLDAILVAEALSDNPRIVTALEIAILALLVGSVVVWLLSVGRWQRGEGAIPLEPRRPVPWRSPEVFIIVGFLLAVTIGGAIYSQGDERAPSLDDFARTFLVGSVVNIALAAGTAMFLALARRADARDLGLVGKLPDDLVSGALGWLAALAPVYALQLVLVNVVKEDRQTHPLIETLRETPRIDVLLLAILAAVIVAPLVEEFFFRVLLQGWLEKQFAPDAHVVPQPSVMPSAMPAADVPEIYAAAVPDEAESPVLTDAGVSVAGVPEAGDMDAGVEPLPDDVPAPDPVFRGWRGAAPIGVSSFLFAAAHAGTWPDPLPLFVLAIVLGYAYRQTHRLWPPVVLHMLFNGLSLAMVWFGA